jgi:hypothetical protein
MTYITYFLAGALLSNGIPHLVNGLSGRSFPKRFPFKKSHTENTPVEKLLFSPIANVIWGIINFIAGYLLLNEVGNFSVGLTMDMFVVIIGFSVGSIFLAWNFGRIHSD